MQVPGAVLQNAGIGQAIDTSGITQANQHNQEMAMRQKEITKRNLENQKQKDEMGLNRFQEHTLGDEKELHTGSPVDPMNINMRAGIMQKAAEMYSKHASDMEVTMALLPEISKLNTYINTAKTVSTNQKSMITSLAKDKGWNVDALNNLVTKKIYYNADGTMKDPRDIDTDVQKAIWQVVTENPEKVSNDAALNEYIDKTPRSTSVQDVTTYDQRGTQNKFKGKIIAPNFSTIETDDSGNTVIVPKYQTAVDGGQKIYHDFTQKDGSVVNAPVRLLDENEYDKLMSSDAATHVMGLIKNHIAEYKDDDGKPVALNSVKAKIVGRALMYNYLKDRAKGDIESSGIVDKPSPQAINLKVYGSKEDQAYQMESGKRKATVDVLGTDEERAADRARGTQSVKGTVEDQARNRAKGAAEGKAGVATPAQQATDPVTQLEKATDDNKALTAAKKFEGTVLPDGSKITKVDKTGWYNQFQDFYITVEKDGKTQDIKFKNKKEMTDYFKKNTAASATIPAKPVPPSTKKQVPGF